MGCLNLGYVPIVFFDVMFEGGIVLRNQTGYFNLKKYRFTFSEFNVDPMAQMHTRQTDHETL